MDRRIRAFFIFTFCIAGFAGCANTDSISEQSRAPAATKAHPATGVNDRFPVNRPMPASRSSGSTEFYFKRCHETGPTGPHLFTSYDCDYP